MEYREIRCQRICSYNKRKPCCFGEIKLDIVSRGIIIERHKCKMTHEFIEIIIQKDTTV